MEFKMATVGVICLTCALAISTVDATSQRALNSLQSSSPSKGKPALTPLQEAENPKHAKIMKQINKVNEDGSYTFGYEADDGSFRVETRSKDGVVKGKYGYVDANGELKVMEYTAGEKTDRHEDEPQVDDEAPRQVTQPRYVTRQSKAAPTIVLPSALQSRIDQASSAQTTSDKVTSPQEDDDEQGDKSEQEDDEPEGQKDVNNGQYFRAVTQGPQPSGAPPSLAGTPGPRYVPSHQLGGGQGQGGPQQFSYAPQQQPGFSTLPKQYAGQGQGSPPPQYQGFPPGYGPQTYVPQQGQGESPLSGQSLPSLYAGQFEDDDRYPYPQQGQGHPSLQGGGGRFPPGYSTRPQQGRGDGSPPNVQIQFRGSPPEDDERQGQQQYFPQQGQAQFAPQQEQGRQYVGFPPSRQQSYEGGRQLGGSPSDRYVPNVDLDGFSEDADEDGFVDDHPNSLSSNSKGGATAAQEKQGVAVKAVGDGRGQTPAGTYRPQILGPQGILQGGQVNNREQQFQQQQPGRSPFGGQQQGQLPPQLTDDQIQQLFAQQQGPYPGQQQQYLGGGGGGQFPGAFPGGQFQGQQQPGFPQQAFLRPGQSPQSRPSLQSQQGGGSFQQNPLLQGQYVLTSQQGGDSDDFSAGFPPQFLPQGGGQPGQGLPPQYFQQQQPQSQQRPLTNQADQFQGQGFPSSQGSQGLPPQFQGQGFSSQGGLPPQFQGQSGQAGGQNQGIQSSGFPFDFNPSFGNQGGFQSLPQGFQQGSFAPPGFQQGPPPQGFASQFQQGGPTSGDGFSPQGGSQGLSQQQLAAILQAQQQQGLGGPQQGGPQGFSPPQIQGFVPGRFPTQGQYLGGGGGGGAGLGGATSGGPTSGLQQSPSSSGQSVQLGGGVARPVQPASSSSSSSPSTGLFGGEERKLSSSTSSKGEAKSN